MTLNQFIFSREPKHRIPRHIAFWLVFMLHFTIQNLMIGGPGEVRTSRSFPDSFVHFLYFIPIYVLSTYFVMEILLRKFLYQRRWAGFIAGFMALFIIQFILIYYSGILYLHHTTNQPFDQISFYANKYHVVVDGLFVPFMLYGIAAGIKLSKKWLLQQRENERLAKQKLASELQLLKTSIHPRFLFHALKTVHRYIQNSSEQSPALVLQLSDLLSYILYEKDENWVPLEKELEIIRYYIQLEEKGYGNSLSFKKEFPGNTAGKFIAPFLLLSIVETSFEYFYESGQQDPALRLIIEIQENTIHFQLFFSRQIDNSNTHLPEPGFTSLQNQLQRQYAGLHHIQVLTDPEEISIHLKLPLYSSEIIHPNRNLIKDEVSEPV